jgi:hypothetical protein
MNPLDYPILVLVLTFVVMWYSARMGDWLRTKDLAKADARREDMKTVLGATLTLLALLIGFSFSMAVSRYDQRKNYEEAEANAIGTEYVRADMTPPDSAAAIQRLLKAYTDQRIGFYTTRSEKKISQINAATADLQAQLWSGVLAAKLPDAPGRALVLAGMNDVLNSQGYTQAAWWNRIPIAAWLLMLLISICCNLLICYCEVRTDRRVLLVVPIAVSIAFLLISDIDCPRGGLIRVSSQNLVSLSQSFPPK